MERREFVKTCGMACVAGAFLSFALQSCSTGNMLSGTLDSSGLSIPLSAFQQAGGGWRKYVVVQHEKLKYPVCVYRLGADSYKALLMQCTHQGAELQVFGDRLECPAHGSAFSDTGAVLNGPADTPLRNFPVTIHNNLIHINLS